jgi:hypothetical protein
MIRVTLDAKGMALIEKKLSALHKDAPKAISRAINRAIKAGATDVSKNVRAQFLIPKGKLDATFRFKNSTPGDLHGEIKSFYAGMLPASDFKLTPKVPSRRARPVRLTVKKGGGGIISRGFIAQMKSGHINAFRRVGTSRLPIKALHTISAPIMVGVAQVAEPAMSRMQEIFDTRLDHEMNRLLGK